MRRILKKKISSRSGFTLAETLMAVLILAMVTAIVAAGVPSAVNAYRKVTEAGNAELLLSTTMTRLRDELGTADVIRADKATGTIVYRNAAGYRSVLTTVADGDRPGIYLQEYDDVVTDSNRADYYHLLVSFEAANKNLFVTYALDENAYQNGIITFKNLSVQKKTDSGAETLNTVETLKIRVLAD